MMDDHYFESESPPRDSWLSVKNSVDLAPLFQAKYLVQEEEVNLADLELSSKENKDNSLDVEIAA